MYIHMYRYICLCIHNMCLPLFTQHTYVYIYIYLFIHTYTYLYAQLVISIHKVRQGKLQTASCWAHASTSCSRDMFNAKSMPKSDQNLEKLDVVVAVGFWSIINKKCSNETCCENRDNVFCLFVGTWKANPSINQNSLKTVAKFFSACSVYKNKSKWFQWLTFHDFSVSQQGEAIRLLQGVLEPEEELGCHLFFSSVWRYWVASA